MRFILGLLAGILVGIIYEAAWVDFHPLPPRPAVAMTEIQDTLRNADGKLYDGTITVYWRGNAAEFQVKRGVVHMSLAPMLYRVRFYSDISPREDRIVEDCWNVPASKVSMLIMEVAAKSGDCKP